MDISNFDPLVVANILNLGVAIGYGVLSLMFIFLAVWLVLVIRYFIRDFTKGEQEDSNKVTREADDLSCSHALDE